MPRRMGIDKALVRGRRVYLRHIYASDRAEYMAVLDASEREMLPWNSSPPKGRSWNDEAGFDRARKTSNTDTSQRHLICRRTDDAIVGMVSLSQIFMGPFCNAYAGWWMGTPFIGQGFGADGVRLCLRRGFGQLKLHRIEANIMPTNTRSLALAHRCGFRHEGSSERYLKIAGKWADHERFAMTVEDWRKPRGRG